MENTPLGKAIEDLKRSDAAAAFAAVADPNAPYTGPSHDEAISAMLYARLGQLNLRYTMEGAALVLGHLFVHIEYQKYIDDHIAGITKGIWAATEPRPRKQKQEAAPSEGESETIQAQDVPAPTEQQQESIHEGEQAEKASPMNRANYKKKNSDNTATLGL